jgi:hypothetical protein
MPSSEWALTVNSVCTLLLWSFWMLCTFAALVAALKVPGLSGFRRVVVLSAARGKTWHSRPVALGSLQVRCLVLFGAASKVISHAHVPEDVHIYRRQ